MNRIMPTGKEVFFAEDDIIVSKTDLRGRILYANSIFLEIAGYTEAEVIGQPHSMIRHPDMPRCVFKLLWDTIQAGEEIFAYVKNMTKSGDHYWVFAHVTPSLDPTGQIVGFHSNRRVPERKAVDTISRIYTELSAIEQREPDARKGMLAGFARLEALLQQQQMAYDQFAFSL